MEKTEVEKRKQITDRRKQRRKQNDENRERE
jgi:hypothetical protein